MTATELNADRMREILGITRIEIVRDIADRLSKTAPSLSTPLPGVCEIVQSSIGSLWYPVKEVSILSIAGVESGWKELERVLPADLYEISVDNFASELNRQISMELWFELLTSEVLQQVVAGLGEDRWTSIQQYTRLIVGNTAWRHFDCFAGERWRFQLRRKVARTLEALIAHRLGVLARDDQTSCESTEGFAISRLLDLYLNGNYPLGRLENGASFDGYLITVA